MGYPTCAILRTDLQAVLLRRAREAGVPVAFGREATAIANDPDGRAVVHFADGGRLSPTWSSARTDACPRWRGPMWPAATRRSIKASSTGSAWPKARATWWTALPSTTIGAWRARRHRGAGAAQGLLGGRAGADAGAGARVGGRRAGRRVAQGAPPVRELARSHRRGHRCHAAAGLRLIAVHDLEPLARWHRGNVLLVGDAAHALAHVGAGRLPGAGGCLASGALPGGSGHGAGRGTGAGAGTVRRIAAGEDGGHHTAGAVLRARVVHHGPAGLPRARRTRARQRSAARRACVGARLGAGLPLPALALAEAGAATVAGSGAGR